MKNILIIFIILLLSFSGAFSQTPFPKPSFEISGGIQIYRFHGTVYDSWVLDTVPVNQLNPMFSFMGSGNIPLKQLKQELYLGINPNVSIGYTYGNFTGDIPVYATIKYGAASTKQSESKIGFGAGAGFFLSVISTTLTSVYTGNIIRYSTAYIAPAVMAEVSLRTEYRGIYQIRADFMPLPIDKRGTFTGQVSQYNLRVIRIF